MSDSTLRDTLLQLELELMSQSVRKSRPKLDELLADDFVEFGSSGRVFDKQSTIEAMQSSPAEETHAIDNCRVVSLSEDTALLTYTCEVSSAAGERLRKSNRSSLWIRSGTGWQLKFHQGTIAE